MANQTQLEVTDLQIAKKLIELNKNAHNRGKHFDVSFAKLKQLMRRKTCYYTGIHFDNNHRRSIDRVDNEKGYTDDNIVVCSERVNQIKSNLTVREIQLVAEKVTKFMENKSSEEINI